MKLTIFFLTSIISALTAADTLRIKKMSFFTAEGELRQIMRLTYNSIGQLVRIVKFDQKGNLISSEYFFYKDRCAIYSKEFTRGKTLALKIINSDHNCRSTIIERKNFLTHAIHIMRYEYSGANCMGFKTVDQAGHTVAIGHYTRSDTLLRRVKITSQYSELDSVYSYDSQNRLAKIEDFDEIEGKKQLITKMIPEYEIGPTTEEAANYFFE